MCQGDRVRNSSMIIMVIVIMIRRVFLERFKQCDHLVVDDLGSGEIAGIAGLVNWAELGRKIFGGEIDLPHGLARNT